MIIFPEHNHKPLLFSIWLNFSEENWKWNWKQNCTEKCSVDGIIWQQTEAASLVCTNPFSICCFCRISSNFFFFGVQLKCIQVWRVTTIRKQRSRPRNNKKLRRTTKAISFVTNMLLPMVMKNQVTLHEGD